MYLDFIRRHKVKDQPTNILATNCHCNDTSKNKTTARISMPNIYIATEENDHFSSESKETLKLTTQDQKTKKNDQMTKRHQLNALYRSLLTVNDATLTLDTI